MRKESRGELQLYTGDAGGKTAAALGLALRSLGHGHKVVVIQFMKGNKNTGEYKIRKRLAPQYEIYQFGRPTYVNLKCPEPVDIRLAEEGLAFARKVLKKKPDLLVLDEINLAVAAGLLKVKDVLQLLDEAPSNTVVILTGRYAPKELIDKVNIANEVRSMRLPKKFTVAREGIEY